MLISKQDFAINEVAEGEQVFIRSRDYADDSLLAFSYRYRKISSLVNTSMFNLGNAINVQLKIEEGI